MSWNHMASKSGAIPKKHRRIARLPSSESENDVENNVTYMGAITKRKLTNKADPTSTIPSTSQLDFYAVDDSTKNIGVSSSNTCNTTKTNMTKKKSDLIKDELYKDSDESFMTELNEMMKKYDNAVIPEQKVHKKNASQSASEVGRAALTAAENKVKASQSKVVDLRDKTVDQREKLRSKTVDQREKLRSKTVDHTKMKSEHTFSVKSNSWSTVITLHGLKNSGVVLNVEQSTNNKLPVIDIDKVRYKKDIRSYKSVSSTRANSTAGKKLSAKPVDSRPTPSFSASTAGRKQSTLALSDSSKLIKRPTTATLAAARSLGTLSDLQSAATKTKLSNKVSSSTSSLKPMICKVLPSTNKPQKLSSTVISTDGMSSALAQCTPDISKKSAAASPGASLNLECPVCFERLLLGNPTVLTSCGHMFCRSCMETIKSHAFVTKCPICRAELKQVIDIHV